MACSQAFLCLELGQLCAIMALQKLFSNRLEFAKTGGRFLLRREDCSAQVKHNEIDNTASTELWLFIIFTGPEGAGLGIAYGS